MIKLGVSDGHDPAVEQRISNMIGFLQRLASLNDIPISIEETAGDENKSQISINKSSFNVKNFLMSDGTYPRTSTSIDLLSSTSHKLRDIAFGLDKTYKLHPSISSRHVTPL